MTRTESGQVEPVRVRLSVAADHPALPGHFPGQPIVPGAVLLTLVANQARIGLGFAAGPSQWRRIKFLAPVEPDQPFNIELSGDTEQFRFEIRRCDGTPIARGQCRHAALA